MKLQDISRQWVVALLLLGFFGSRAEAKGKTRPLTYADVVKTTFTLTLAFPGQAGPVDYEKFGTFQGIGTDKYKYVINDVRGLADAVGEGIFPNKEVTRDPVYMELKKTGALEGNHWAFVNDPAPALNFYKWAGTTEEPGIKQFYTALMLERAGLLEEAIKGFYAAAVHFPRSSSLTYYRTPWYIGPGVIDRIELLLRRHPAIKMELRGGRIVIDNRFDNDLKNDVFSIDPGRLVKVKRRKEPKPVPLSKLKVIKTVGGPRTQLEKYENGHWQFLVEGKPFLFRAITYSVTPVGLSPDRGTWDLARHWQYVDTNNNGLHDGLFESYVDKNENGIQDADEPTVGDARLLKELGVNTLRVYHHVYNKELFRQLYQDYGFHIICGDLIGGYAIGSGANWYQGTDYSNPRQQEKMLAGVRSMVEEMKDEPYVLMWVLGNENVYGSGSNADKNPEAFYDFVNRAARLIHELDPSRPVALANGDLAHLNLIRSRCPEIDVMGANAYRGEQGFGRHLFMAVRALLDKPVLITEYGCSAIAENYTTEQAEAYQAMYLANSWEDLEANRAGRGIGNALGGVLFEFIDEWWKANADLPDYVQKERGEWYQKRSAIYKNLQPHTHDTVPQFGFPFLDGWSYEEWYGIASQGSGKGSPFARILRPAYHQMREMWKSYESF